MTLLLTVSYWFHLLATIIWLGSLTTVALFALPAWREQNVSHNTWLALQRRLSPWVNGSMAVLWVTGFLQMTFHEQYTGFLAVDNRWAWAILIKHIGVIGMTVLSIYMQWQLYPAFERLALLGERKSAETHRADLITQEQRYLRINLLCAALVLLFTAVATVS